MAQEQEALGQVDHWINTKKRRVAISRGPDEARQKLADGFKKCTPAHFLRYIAQSQNGFRKSKKA